jgi:hypothetical protein
MAPMLRLAAAMILSPVVFAQTAQDAELAIAAKSPITLARYIESHSVFDWGALWRVLGTREPHAPPCGGAPYNLCVAQIVTVSNPPQSILIVQGGLPRSNDLYLRFLGKAGGDWQFAGERLVYVNNGLRRHEVTKFWGKPFLKISSDHSQVGASVDQEIEDWFDLTQPDFEPVFSFTTDGSAEPFGFAVGLTIHAQCIPRQVSGIESIDLILNVHFVGPGLDLPATYIGVYERPTNEEKFTLRSAYSGLDHRTAIPTKDLEELADPFEGPSNEKLLVYALPGLQKIATGSDPEAKEWLHSILEDAKDTPEKRTLLELLRKPSAPAQPAPPKPQ